MQTIEQVLAKRPAFTSAMRLRFVAEMSRTSTFTGLRPRLALPRLPEARAIIDLRGERQFADFVKKERPARCFQKLADVPLGRARERTFLVSEKNGFNQIVRDGAAIDRTKAWRTVRPSHGWHAQTVLCRRPIAPR